MIEKLDKRSLILEVVSLDLAESCHKLEAFSIVECVMDFERCWLHVLEAELEQRVDSVG